LKIKKKREQDFSTILSFPQGETVKRFLTTALAITTLACIISLAGKPVQCPVAL